MHTHISNCDTDMKYSRVIEKNCSIPFISIITIVFRDLNGLKRTKNSVFSQTYLNFEWIVVDGGSVDGTVEFLKKADDFRIVWVSERDCGIYDAMNKGIVLSSGEYVVFLNAGDTFPNPYVLEAVKSHLATNFSKYEVLFGGALLVFRNGFELYRKPFAIEQYIWHGLPAIHQATYYRRDRISKILYDLAYKICGDYYIIAKMYKDEIRATYMDVPLVKFQIGGVSYKNISNVFIEPYRIQKEVLIIPLQRRLLSLSKRILSKAATLAIHSNILFLKDLVKYIYRRKPAIQRIVPKK